MTTDMTTGKKFGVGIIGFGRIGAEHSQWIAAAGGIVTAVVDITRARRSLAEARGLTTVDSMDALLERGDVDAVLVTTPTNMHFDHASRAISAGKHVMVDKPVALDLAQTTKLDATAHQMRRVLSVFHNRRWDIDYLTVLQAVRAGLFGRLINIESRLGQWGSCVGPAANAYRPGWRNERRFGGGGLYDWGSHFVDQILQLMLPAKPASVFAQLRGNVWTRDCDDFARVCISFDNNAVAMVEINTTTTAPLPRWHIDGTAGSAESPFSLSYDTQTWANLRFTAPDGSNRLIERAQPGLSEADLWRAFQRACNGEGEPAVTLQSVTATMRVLDAARKSSRTNRSVELIKLLPPPRE